MASPAALATTLEGTRGGLGLFVDPDIARLYRALGVVWGRWGRPLTYDLSVITEKGVTTSSD
jgi:hypothetical protein